MKICSSATAAVGLMVKLRQQWGRYLPFDLGSSPTTVFLSDELTLPTKTGPQSERLGRMGIPWLGRVSGGSDRGTLPGDRCAAGFRHASFLAQTYFIIGACERTARWCYSPLGSHIIGVIQRVSVVGGHKNNNAKY